MNFIFTGYKNLPDDNWFKLVISFPLAIIFGGMCNMVISFFSTMPVVFISQLDNTRYEKYMYKLTWVLVVLINLYIVYFAKFHFAFEHASTPYYNLLYEITRFFAWSTGPFYANRVGIRLFQV